VRWLGIFSIVLVLTGCASPREKDCKAVVPLVEQSMHARAMPFADAGGVQAFAERPRQVAGELRALRAADPTIALGVTALAGANERLATAMGAFDELRTAMRIKPGSPAVGLEVVESTKPDVQRLLERCGIVMRTEEQRALPDCIALERALERCITPPTDDTTAADQLMACATALDAVRSDEAAANESIHRIASALRSIEPVARNIGTPARELIRIAMRLSPTINAHTAARDDALRAEQTLRDLCRVGR
jgi:hypothetical protein